MSPTVSTAPSATLFQRLLGAEFFHLAPAVKNLHLRQGEFAYAGRGSITRGRGPLVWMLASIAGLPPTMPESPVEVSFTTSATAEEWRRRFGTVAMHSRMVARDGLLWERLGPVTFGFQLVRAGNQLAWAVERVRVLGLLPLPARLFDDVRCREGEDEDGRYTYFVQAALPIMGLLIRYQGWLAPAAPTGV